jgi:Short C-terminal domain
MDFNASSFWDVLLWSLFFFVWIAFVFIWVRCVFDLFNDTQLGAVLKILWLIDFIFFAPLTTLVYLIVRGRGMTERQLRAAQEAKERQEKYIQEASARTSPASPTEQIASAKTLLDAGAITQAEFDALKARALTA